MDLQHGDTIIVRFHPQAQLGYELHPDYAADLQADHGWLPWFVQWLLQFRTRWWTELWTDQGPKDHIPAVARRWADVRAAHYTRQQAPLPHPQLQRDLLTF